MAPRDAPRPSPYLGAECMHLTHVWSAEVRSQSPPAPPAPLLPASLLPKRLEIFSLANWNNNKTPESRNYLCASSHSETRSTRSAFFPITDRFFALQNALRSSTVNCPYLVNEPLNHFTTNVPWQGLLPRTSPERFARQSTSSISPDLSDTFRYDNQLMTDRFTLRSCGGNICVTVWIFIQ